MGGCTELCADHTATHHPPTFPPCGAGSVPSMTAFPGTPSRDSVSLCNTYPCIEVVKSKLRQSCATILTPRGCHLVPVLTTSGVPKYNPSEIVRPHLHTCATKAGSSHGCCTNFGPYRLTTTHHPSCGAGVPSTTFKPALLQRVSPYPARMSHQRRDVCQI
jgi:hypothetical protein